MKKIVILNHKSFLTLEEAKTYPIDINDYIRNDQTVIICPSDIYLPYFKGKYNFKVGAQNISPENITGEITGKVLKSNEINYVLIGHHERKNTLGETKELINKKIKEAIKHNITPIVILGETFYENEMKKTGEVITKQIKDYFYEIKVSEEFIIAYEPNWNFTNKQTPSKEHIEEVINLIKNIIKRKYNVNTKVIYGGHITSNNIKNIDKIPNINGFLIGKSSIDLKEIKEVFDNIE